MRTCARCAKTLEGMRPHAIYCSRSCKTLAACDRRIDRDPGYDARRYPKEAEKRREYARKYLQEHPEQMRIVRRRRKGQVRGSVFVFTDRDWNRVVARYRGCCAYCGVRSDDLHREHVIPLSRGGQHSIGNILPACSRCNLSKKSRYLSDWRYRVLINRERG